MGRSWGCDRALCSLLHAIVYPFVWCSGDCISLTVDHFIQDGSHQIIFTCSERSDVTEWEELVKLRTVFPMGMHTDIYRDAPS